MRLLIDRLDQNSLLEAALQKPQAVGHVNNIPTMQFLIGIFRITQSKLYILSLIECVWDFQNNALRDTH